MTNIKSKDINQLDTWNPKELRKLRMLLKNRIQTLEKSSTPKELASSHPLFEMDMGECKALLENVTRAEKKR